MTIQESKLFFVHIPHCGGTFVEKAFKRPKSKGEADRHQDGVTLSYGREDWVGFALVRNPFNRARAHYVGFLNRTKRKVGFHEWLTMPCDSSRAALPQNRFLLGNEKLFKYEAIGPMNQWLAEQEIEVKVEQPPVAIMPRSPYWTKETAAIIVERYAEDFETFNYSTDPFGDKVPFPHLHFND